MCMRFNDYKNVVEEYCKNNSLDFTKALTLVKGCGNNSIILQYHDPKKGDGGLRNETPMPIVLKIFSGVNGIRFEQTEYTHKYLSQ